MRRLPFARSFPPSYTTDEYYRRAAWGAAEDLLDTERKIKRLMQDGMKLENQIHLYREMGRDPYMEWN